MSDGRPSETGESRIQRKIQFVTLLRAARGSHKTSLSDSETVVSNQIRVLAQWKQTGQKYFLL